MGTRRQKAVNYETREVFSFSPQQSYISYEEGISMCLTFIQSTIEQQLFFDFQNFFAFDRQDPNLDYDISFLKIRQKLLELWELEGKKQSIIKPERSFHFRHNNHTSLMKKAY